MQTAKILQFTQTDDRDVRCSFCGTQYTIKEGENNVIENTRNNKKICKGCVARCKAILARDDKDEATGA